MVFGSTRRETEVALQRVKWFPLAYGFRGNSTTNHLSMSSPHSIIVKMPVMGYLVVVKILSGDCIFLLTRHLEWDATTHM